MSEEILYEIVKNHFSLNSPSLERFKDICLNKEKRLEYIPEHIHDMLDENFRIRRPFSSDLKENLDLGWTKFRNFFSVFLRSKNIETTYSDFSNNKIKINKNEYKLFKFLKSLYLETASVDEKLDLLCIAGISVEEIYGEVSDYYVEDAFKIITQEIGKYKMPNTDLEIVISYNLSDWLLSATSENWSSCLNLESNYERCFWSGLPGLAIDKNRALMYITDGKSKFYHYKDGNGITSEKMLTRTWLLLSDSDVYIPLRFYPTNLLKSMKFEDIFENISISSDEAYSSEDIEYLSKYPIDFLRNIYEESVFIYLDMGMFVVKDDKIYIASEESGCFATLVNRNGKNKFFKTSSYSYSDGLDQLISENSELSDHHAITSILNVNKGMTIERATELYFQDEDWDFLRTVPDITLF